MLNQVGQDLVDEASDDHGFGRLAGVVDLVDPFDQDVSDVGDDATRADQLYRQGAGGQLGLRRLLLQRLLSV